MLVSFTLIAPFRFPLRRKNNLKAVLIWLALETAKP